MFIRIKIQVKVPNQNYNPQSLCRSNINNCQMQIETSDLKSKDTLRCVIPVAIKQSNTAKGTLVWAFKQGATTGISEKRDLAPVKCLTYPSSSFSTSVFHHGVLNQVGSGVPGRRGQPRSLD